MLEIWLARDENKRLYAYVREPHLNHAGNEYVVRAGNESTGHQELPKDWFPEITFENSPVKMTLSKGLAVSIQTEPIKRRR